MKKKVEARILIILKPFKSASFLSFGLYLSINAFLEEEIKLKKKKKCL
jgi:hypothetical protein